MELGQQFDNNNFDSEPLYNEERLKTKIKSYDDKINTNFHDDRMPNEGCHCVNSSVIEAMGRNCYSKIFLWKSVR